MKKYFIIILVILSATMIYRYVKTHHYYKPDLLTHKIPIYQAQTFPYQDFGKDFLFGISTAAPQVEEISSFPIPGVPSAPNTLTSSYINRFRIDDAAIAKFKNWQEPGQSCHGYSDAHGLVDLAAELGCNAYRFTIEWSRVNPEPNVFRQEVIDHYVDLAKYVRSKNMVPMVFLNHYVDPIWFIDMGGFEKEENLHYAISYCTIMIDALSPYVDMFVSFNQPTAYVRKGYIAASQMPFIKSLPTKDGISPQAATVFKNLFDVIFKVAQYIHEHGKLSGICHQYAQAETTGSAESKESAAVFDRYYNQSFFNYFKDKQDVIDFVAWQYYSRLRIDQNPDGSENLSKLFDHELALKTDDIFRFLDEEGFYNSLEICAQHFPNKPIYVTENGCNTLNEEYATNYLDHYLSALLLAKQQGINVQGYFYWTLIDNYEWGKNFTAHYGMFTLPDRKLRERGSHYQTIIQNWNKTITS